MAPEQPFCESCGQDFDCAERLAKLTNAAPRAAPTFEEWWEKNGCDYVTTRDLARDAWFAAAAMYAENAMLSRRDATKYAIAAFAGMPHGTTYTSEQVVNCLRAIADAYEVVK